MEENDTKNQAIPGLDIKSKVMQKIRARQIRMTHPGVVVAKKLGLQSVLALSIIAGAIAISSVFYVLKKVGVLQLLSSDLPGAIGKIILYMPYDYIVLFLITIIIGAFLIREIFYFEGMQFSKRISAIFLFLVTLIIGLIFGYAGIGQVNKGLAGQVDKPVNAVSK